jgi:hypothetical protein
MGQRRKEGSTKKLWAKEPGPTLHFWEHIGQTKDLMSVAYDDGAISVTRGGDAILSSRVAVFRPDKLSASASQKQKQKRSILIVF